MVRIMPDKAQPLSARDRRFMKPLFQLSRFSFCLPPLHAPSVRG